MNPDMEPKPRTLEELNQSIALLEQRQEMELLSLKQSSDDIVASLRPANLIKQIIGDVLEDRELGEKIRISATSAVGSIMNDWLIGKVENPLLRMVLRLASAPVTRFTERLIKRWL